MSAPSEISDEQRRAVSNATRDVRSRSPIGRGRAVMIECSIVANVAREVATQHLGRTAARVAMSFGATCPRPDSSVMAHSQVR